MNDESYTPSLTPDDVARLLTDPSAQTRAETSTKIATQFDADRLGAAERAIAEDIFRTLIKDTEIVVREALSAHLKATPHLPHDIALALARDVDTVALPMLRFSEVLTDEDLIEIMRGSSAAKQVAVAQRPALSRRVSDAVVNTENSMAVVHLVANEGADLSESALDRVMHDYRDTPAVTDTLARRSNLPPAVSERLLAAVTEKLRRYLVSKHEVSADVASNLILQVRERATMNLLKDGSSDLELEQLIGQLYGKKRLTASLLLRALCVGDLNFFERAMARLTSLPLGNVRVLIHDKGMLGLEPLYLRAKLPKTLFPAIRAAINLVVETDYDGGRNDRQRYVDRLLQRLLTQFSEPSTRIAPDDIEYLVGKLLHTTA